MKTALCTGSAGFVGRHLCTALAADGYELLKIDIKNGVDAIDFFRRNETHFDLVIHCAALVGGRTMIDGKPLELAVADLALDAEMFRWATKTRPGRIVYFSSSAAYPVAMQAKSAPRYRLTESDIGGDTGQPHIPDATYGWVKLTGERLAAEANKMGVRTHVFRPFSGYGADQDLDYPWPAIHKRALEQAGKADTSPFEIWGDPGSARDWVHIDDVVDCVMTAIEADDIGPMNIATGRATTFRQLAALVLDAVGLGDTPIVGNDTKPSGVYWRVGDPTRMRQIYVPKVTVEEGIARTLFDLRGQLAA